MAPSIAWTGWAVRDRVSALAREDLLLFATGGLAARAASAHAGSTNDVDSYSYGQSSGAMVGWTVGDGGKFAAHRNISLKVERL